MSRSLPPKPNIAHLKNQAKDILKRQSAGDKSVCDVLKKLNRYKSLSDEKILAENTALNEVQFALAIDYGFKSWDAMIKHVRSLIDDTDNSISNYNSRRVFIENLPKLSWEHSGATTYAGALSSALSVTEYPLTYADIMGFSGLAFRLRWYRRTDIPEWCFSSPTGEFPEEMKATQANTGWLFDIYDKPTLSDQELSRLYDKIIHSIDIGIPVIGHANDLDVAVLQGYEIAKDGIYFLWNSYNSPKALRLPKSQIERMIIIPVSHNSDIDTADSVINALSLYGWRQRSWTPPDYPEKREHSYLFGDLAFKTWMDDLIRADSFTDGQRELLYRVSNWCFLSLVDSRKQAGIFLDSHAHFFSTEISGYLKNAAVIYNNQYRLLAEARETYPIFVSKGAKGINDRNTALRKREIAVLKEALDLDRRAIAEIDKALEEQKTHIE